MRHGKLLACLAFGWACAGVAAHEITFDGGVCRPQEDGSFALTLGGREVTLDGVYISKGWGFFRQKNCATAEVKDGKLAVTFTPPPAPFEPLKDHPFTIRLIGRDDPKGLYRVGGTVGTFDQGQSWGWGTTFELMPHQTLVSWEGAASVSCWGGKSGDWNFRLPAPKPLTVFFSKANIALKKPVNVVEQKREQYRRILVAPQEEGFDTTKYLAKLAEKKLSRADLSAMEDLFDARSRLVSLADRLRHKPTADTAADEQVRAGYTALTAMDLAGVTNACAALEPLVVGSETWMPLTAFNPVSWVKSFTQWGYMKHPDGVGVYEPTPWNLLWQDGFRFTVAQDARVVAAHPGNKPGRYLETRYLKPMTDVYVTRTWTDTTWSLPDRKVTFSLLSPVVAVEGVETLTLGGFPSAPFRLEWVRPNGGYGFVQLTAEPAEEAEIVASVLMDFKTPAPKPEPPSWGVQKIDPQAVARPWLRLRSKSGWEIALFPTARPVAASWSKGVFSLKLEKPGDVGVLRLRDNLHPQEQPEVMEFFARQFTTYPVRCTETAREGDATWSYGYKLRENAWGLKPRKLAPVPPLADYAGCAVTGLRRFKYPTKWGIFPYVEGERVSCGFPSAPREAKLRGVNVSAFAGDAEWEAHVTNGAHWVRLYWGGKRPFDEVRTALEDKLGRYGRRGLKFLIDPHCYGYHVGWQTCADPKDDAAYLELWDSVSKVCARYADAVAGYDLYNEPGLTAGAEERWRELNERVSAVIRKNHPGARIYYPGIYGGNPNGMFNLKPLEIEGPQTVTFHFYTPHAFTHQKCATHNAGGDTCVFYPGWAPEIDWVGGTHFGGTTVEWFDKWTLAASLLPVFEHWAEWKAPLHCGEFSVIGYANGKSPNGAFLWTRDSVELIEHVGASWHLWNGGFGLGNAQVRAWMYPLWKQEAGKVSAEKACSAIGF